MTPQKQLKLQSLPKWGVWRGADSAQLWTRYHQAVLAASLYSLFASSGLSKAITWRRLLRVLESPSLGLQDQTSPS